MDDLTDKIYELPGVLVTDFQDIWKLYQKICDEVEEEDFLVKNLNLFLVKLCMRKIAKEKSLNDGHKVEVTDFIKANEKENNKVRVEFDNTIE